MLKKLSVYTVCFLTIIGCNDEATVGSADMEQTRNLVSDARVHDIQIVAIPDITVDAWVDPCLDITNTHVRFCDCNPNCCQQQTWYCPPRGVEIQAKYAVLDICDENLVPCAYLEHNRLGVTRVAYIMGNALLALKRKRFAIV